MGRTWTEGLKADTTNLACSADETRVFRFLDGSEHRVPADACRGCFMAANPALMPSHIDPVVEGTELIVRQDAEWPVPGFYIVSLRSHVRGYGDVQPETAADVGVAIHAVRKGLEELFGIERSSVYHEEKFVSPHLHVWVLPLWPEVVREMDRLPRIYDDGVMDYVHRFSFKRHGDRIAECNRRMRDYLQTSECLRGSGSWFHVEDRPKGAWQ